jgi:hypothetical protein
MTSHGTHCEEACEVLIFIVYVILSKKSTPFIKILLKIF